MKKRKSSYNGYLRKAMHPMRYLYFTVNDEAESAKKLFPLIFSGLLSTQKPLDLKKEARTYDKLLSKFEAVKPKDDNAELESDVVVALEDAEFSLMLECLEKVQWTPVGARTAYKALDWLNSSPSEPKKLELMDGTGTGDSNG